MDLPGHQEVGAVDATEWDLGCEIDAFVGAVDKHDAAVHAQRLMDACSAARRLSAMPTSRQLVDDACAELVECCAFGRAVLSRVEHATWRPLTGHFVTGRSEPEWLGAWIDRPIELNEMLVETRVVRGHRPVLVEDTARSPVYRPMIIDAGRSGSYVVAPVVVRGEVVGLFHADHGPVSRRCDGVDRDVLWTFAQGFGLVYERLVLAEEYRAQRTRLHDALASTQRMLSSPSGDLVPDGIDEGGPLCGPLLGGVLDEGGAGTLADATEEPLTSREREVLELMAVGATNPMIASELVVSASTVKSHVRHILRKLGAVNRAQAIARYLGSPD
ncbi:LuxR C-terminal-related transcriptional regulator [Nocardioides sp. NPDC057767]|uniref:LuxR C-terminal-related transcriptional regulator n=1 Tax=unclassified Nocardioides TaxID=2615069 RepID=UPI0033234088